MHMLVFQGAARWKCLKQPSMSAVPCVMLWLAAGAKASDLLPRSG